MLFCSVRTPISMKFFPRFFLLYFLVFHIYFFSYPYGFSYVAFAATAVFMQHLILYFWNRFEVPALQRFMQNRRSQIQQQADIQFTSSTILASALHITRLNMRNSGSVGMRNIRDQSRLPNAPQTEFRGPEEASEANNNANTLQVPDPPQPRAITNPNSLSSFSSMLFWILGGASSEGRNPFFSLFRDVREQGEVYPDPLQQENSPIE
ncbi:hypothetical protein GIB67_022234 [Kingdonia uniflora]|uniref:Uncharacterized protein n=1 Tax=Kingdonia uniflora TaxID=39325 RepID=A0A7J7M6Z4_9MAGN|nr:hypothetical protein GIB67_022234 [Kingdonia uniflora]